MVKMYNTVFKTAVVRDRKLALPLAPNRLPELPLPKAAPMSAPLPCWIKIRPIMASADSSCAASRTVTRTLMLIPRFVAMGNRHSAGCGNDGQEVWRLECRPPDQAAIDVRLSQQLRGIGGIHAASVQDRNALCLRRSSLQLCAQHRMDLLGLFRRGGLARSNRPDRLIGHHDLADAMAIEVDYRGQLALD